MAVMRKIRLWNTGLHLQKSIAIVTYKCSELYCMHTLNNQHNEEETWQDIAHEF